MRPVDRRYLGRWIGAVGSAAVATCLATACTSSGSAGNPSPPAPAGPSAPGAAATGTPASRTPTSSTPASAAPAGLAGLDGTLLLAGPTAGKADVYEISGSAVTRRTSNAHLRTVTADATRVVVSTGAAVGELRGGRLAGIGLSKAFSATLSSSGALAWLTVQDGSSTPGVSKPKGFELHVRSSGTGAGRVVYRATSSLGPPEWDGTRALVVAVAPNSGPGTEILRIDVATGRARTLAALDGISALDLTVGTRAITASTADGRVLVVSDAGDVQADTPLDGSTPLCWTSPTSLLTAKGTSLRSVSVSNGKVGTARTLGTVPAPVYSASCARTGS